MRGLRFTAMSMFLLFGIAISFAQKEANIWYFGYNAGLDFNTGSPVGLTDGATYTFTGTASIADTNGNLLFYSDGNTVWNKNHTVMQNGTGLLTSLWFEFGAGDQFVMAVPKPNSTNIYYLFTSDAGYGLRYSEIDMTMDNGLGAITNIKNVYLSSGDQSITAVSHANGQDIWVLTHGWLNLDISYAFLVTSSGVVTTPIISYFENYGRLKFSPDGKKLAIQTSYSTISLYNFDNATGLVSNPIAFSVGQSTEIKGIEFSPSSNILYVSGYYDLQNSTFFLRQFDLTSVDISNSKIDLSLGMDINAAIWGLQLGPDHKIYANNWSYLEFISVINAPDNLGTACNFIKNGVYLNGGHSAGAFPQFIQSYFSVKIQTENVCLGEATQFHFNSSNTYDSLLWDFGDGNTSTDVAPEHTYAGAGDFTVTLTVYSGSQSSTDTKTITIYQTPTATEPPAMIICDDDSDGYSFFDLTLQDDAILNGQDPTVYEVIYYTAPFESAGTLITNPTSFVNALYNEPQAIYARVKNRFNQQCEAMTSFSIIPFLMPDLQVTKLSLCDDSSVGTEFDGLVQMDFTQMEQVVLPGFNPQFVELTYFTDASLQNEISDPTQYQNTNRTETIYVVASYIYIDLCSGETHFTLEVYSPPIVSSGVELKQCDDDLDGFSLFNLNEVINEITVNAANEMVTFYKTESDAEQGINAIINPTAYRNQTVSSDVVWARVESAITCFRTSQVNLTVTTTQIPDTFIKDFRICDHDVDGVTRFDFSSIHTEIESMFPVGQQLTISYYRNEADALAEANSITDISNYSNVGYPYSQQIYVRVDGKLDNDCLGLGAHINLYVEPIPVANPVTIDRRCDDDGDGMFAFDTSQIEADALGGQSLVDVTISYFDGNNNPLPSPLPNPFITSSQLVTIRVTSNNVLDGSCYNETTLEFIVDNVPIAYQIMVPSTCDEAPDDTDGFYPFDTSSIENEILNGQTGFEVHYFDESGTELPSPLPNPFLSKSQTITVKVDNPLNDNCYDITSFDFVVNPLPEFTIESPQIVCSSDPTFTVTMDPLENNTSELFDYEWRFQDGTLLSNATALTVSTPGTYSITLTKTDGTSCSRTREIFVNASELATITAKDFSIVQLTDNNSITINNGNNNLGLGDYEFALDHIAGIYQDEPYFDHLSASKHTLYVKDKKGCGIAQLDIFIMGFPKFFTPNDDGFHDTWNIEGLGNDYTRNSRVYIFDRYGKLLIQLDPKGASWNGTFNGEKLRPSDYWFVAELHAVDGTMTTYRGHFSLVR